MTKKISAGLYVACVSAVFALVGLIAYVVNTGTNYYAKMGLDTTVVICLALAAALSVVRIVVGMKGNPLWADVLPVCATVLSVVGFMLLVNARVNNLAAVFTFENSAANMADTTSCIIAIAAALLAMLTSFFAAFMDVTKE